jgi:hypothetical protein
MYISLNLLFNDTGGKEFKAYNYNNGTSFSSIGCKMDQSVYGSHGIYTFRIQGELYHLMGSLLPMEGQDPAFAQSIIIQVGHWLATPAEAELVVDVLTLILIRLSPRRSHSIILPA